MRNHKLGKRAVFLLAAAAVFCGCSPSSPIRAAGAPLQKLDQDNDGMVELAEAQAAGAAMFASRDADRNGLLDVRELEGILDQKTFAAADHDLKGTLDQPEYAAIVEARFKAANTNADAALDPAELNTPAGERLLAVITSEK